MNEFRYNKKRKHYAYIIKICGEYRVNIPLSTKSTYIDKKNKKVKLVRNIKISCHPNPNKNIKSECYYIVNHKPYLDHFSCFSSQVYVGWKWNKNDKRIVKRFKKYKKYIVYFKSA